MSKCAINIYKGGSIKATMYNDSGIFDTWKMLDKAQRMLRQFNKYLYSYDLPDVVLSHRLLEEENVEMTIWEFGARIYPKSYEYVTENFPGYIWPDENYWDDHLESMIALCEEDIAECNGKAEHVITIDLDTKKIYLYNFFRGEVKSEYCDRMGIGFGEFDKIDFPEIDLDTSYLNFNELEDYLDVIKQHRKGWKTGVSNLVISPISEVNL